MSYALVFRAYPDVDHMAPLAWRLLEEGEDVHAIISPGYEPESDYRLRYLARYRGFHLHRITAPSLRASLPWALAFLLRHNVRLVAVEWGYGLPGGYDRLRSAKGVEAVLRSIAGSLLRRSDPQQVRTNFTVAARLLGRACVSLPHGLSVKLGRRSEGGKLLAGPYDWRDRNRFDAFVLNTAHHRDWIIERAAGDPAVVQTWGSLRWAPEWFELNLSLAPHYAWPEPADRAAGSAADRLKVVLMVPKWANFVDRDATRALVRRLSSLDWISFAIKGHPRPEDGSTDPLHEDPEIDWSRITDVTAVDSVSVIAAADVVVDVGSSIGIEAVMQGKVLINPSYIHDFWTFFDEVRDSCVIAGSADEVVAYLRRHAAGVPHQVTDEAYRELLRRGVYGSQPEPFDVIGTYCERVKTLAHPTNRRQ
ncbi:MAG TPA: hypothetical protein VMD48_12370 [Solirubrobacteraceae bacterium]|nr:hypothetical protein [Solirubrobacteraceae bacterium]